MKEFFEAGGYGMWFVLLFAGVALVAAVRFALRPAARKLSPIRAMTWTAVFAILSAVASDFTAVMWKVTGRSEWANSPDMPLLVMRGLGEAATPAILGFNMLALTWLFVAVGTRRHQSLDD